MIDLTLADICSGLRAFLLDLTTIDNQQILIGPISVDKLPEGNTIVMVPQIIKRLSATRTHFNPHEQPTTQYLNDLKAFTFQLDFYGSYAYENASIIETIWQSTYGLSLMIAKNDRLAPLYCGDIKQAAIIDDTKQYQQRYTLDVTLQPNQTISLPVDMFDSIEFTTEQANK